MIKQVQGKGDSSIEQLEGLRVDPKGADLHVLAVRHKLFGRDPTLALVSAWPNMRGDKLEPDGDESFSAMAIFPGDEVVLQVKDKKGFRGYSGRIEDKDVVIDLKDLSGDDLEAALRDLMDFSVPGRSWLDVEVNNVSPQDLLRFTAREDSMTRVRVKEQGGDGMRLHLRPLSQSLEGLPPHVQDLLCEAYDPVKVRVFSDDPQVLDNVDQVSIEARRQVCDMRDHLSGVHPVQEDEIVNLSFSTPKSKHGAAATHNLVEGRESDIRLVGERKSYHFEDGGGINIDKTSVQAEMLHHVLDVALGEKAFDNVGVGTKLAVHELFDDLRLAYTWDARIIDLPFMKPYLLAYDLPTGKLPGLNISGHMLIESGILQNAVHAVRNVSKPKRGVLSNGELAMYDVLLNMDYSESPAMYDFAFGLFNTEAGEAVKTAYDFCGVEQEFMDPRWIVDYPKDKSSPLVARDVVARLPIDDERKGEFLAEVDQIAADHAEALRTRGSDGGDDGPLTSLVRINSKKARPATKTFLERVASEISDQGLLIEIVQDYVKLAVFHHLATRQTDESEDYTLIQKETIWDEDRRETYYSFLEAEGEQGLRDQLVDMKKGEYDPGKAKAYYTLRKRVFRLQSDALKKANADDPDIVERLEASDRDLDQLYLARIGIIETQDHLEKNLLDPHSHMSYTTQMPDGHEKTFATQLHYLDALMSGYAEGEYTLVKED